MKNLKRTLLVVLSLISSQAFPCSVVTAVDQNKSITGYTMDWTGFVKPDTTNNRNYVGGGYFLMSAGVTKHPVFNKDSKFKWTSKYKSLVLSTMGPAYAFNGINEKGLEVFELGTPSLIRDHHINNPVVSEADVLTLLLDTAQDVNEAIALLNSIQVEQFLFPLHYYIKDKSGHVIIADYKDGLRIHEAKPGRQFVTNNWYDREQDAVDHHESIVDDNRAKYIDENIKSTDDVESVITAVGTKNMTMWQTFTTVSTDQWLYKIRVNTAKIGVPEFTKDVVFDLNKLFAQEIKNKKPYFLLFSDVLIKSQNPADLRELTSNELGLIQVANFLYIGKWADGLFSRNEEKDKEIWNNFLNLREQIKTMPFDNVVDSDIGS